MLNFLANSRLAGQFCFAAQVFCLLELLCLPLQLKQCQSSAHSTAIHLPLEDPDVLPTYGQKQSGAAA